MIGLWLGRGAYSVLWRHATSAKFGGVSLAGIECEANLSHDGNVWVHDVAQVYGPGAVVRGNGRIRGEAWVLGRVEDDAEVCDLAIVRAGVCRGGRIVLLSDAIASGAPKVPMRRRPTAGPFLRV